MSATDTSPPWPSHSSPPPSQHPTAHQTESWGRTGGSPGRCGKGVLNHPRAGRRRTPFLSRKDTADNWNRGSGRYSQTSKQNPESLPPWASIAHQRNTKASPQRAYPNTQQRTRQMPSIRPSAPPYQSEIPEVCDSAIPYKSKAICTSYKYCPASRIFSKNPIIQAD